MYRLDIGYSKLFLIPIDVDANSYNMIRNKAHKSNIRKVSTINVIYLSGQ